MWFPLGDYRYAFTLGCLGRDMALGHIASCPSTGKTYPRNSASRDPLQFHLSIRRTDTHVRRRVARTINPDTNLGGPHVGFTCGAFDFAFFLLLSPLRKPFTPPLIRTSRLAVFLSL